MGKLMGLPVFRYLFIPGAVFFLVTLGILYFYRGQVSAVPDLLSIINPPKTVTAFARSIDGYSQVVINYDGKETIITDDRFNNSDIFARGNYVVWIRELPEESQVVRYEASSRTDATIANDGIYERPRVDKKGNVVWQRWNKEADDWYISYFNGRTNHTSLHGLYPDIDGTRMLFTRKADEQNWDLIELDLKSKIERVLISNPGVKQSWFDSDHVYFPGGKVSFQPSPTPSPVPSPSPFVETGENPPDRVEGEPSAVPPADERLFSGEILYEEQQQDDQTESD